MITNGPHMIKCGGDMSVSGCSMIGSRRRMSMQTESMITKRVCMIIQNEIVQQNSDFAT
ncbi:hypothetical protein NCCP2331_11140 [Sporosarcina sp. NCCP-2331]|nr:hypothetical protein NCCP2331_11140 [Sporosarcina sp. NCCP-2331]GLB56596.1 hypothetical protein NCCP2378_23830 [Sporosarcina sp. NCCP-2378]